MRVQIKGTHISVGAWFAISLEAEASNAVGFSNLHQEPTVVVGTFHHCVSDNYIADAQWLATCNLLLKRLWDCTFGSRIVIKCEEQLLRLRTSHKVKTSGTIGTQEFHDIRPAEDADISHTSESTLKDRVTRPIITPQYYSGEIDGGASPNLSRARGGKGWSTSTSNKYFIIFLGALLSSLLPNIL